MQQISPDPQVQAEFDELYRLHADSVYQYLYFFLRGAEICEDLFQEVFLKAYYQLQRNQGRREISKTWFITVAKNAALDWQKKNSVRREISHDPDYLDFFEDVETDFIAQLERKEL